MVLTVFIIYFTSHMTIPAKVPLITVKDMGVQELPGRQITANSIIMGSLTEMIQATFTKESQTPATAFSCSFPDEKGTALSRFVCVSSTANSPAQIAAWCFQSQGEPSLLAGRFSMYFMFRAQGT